MRIGIGAVALLLTACGTPARRDAQVIDIVAADYAYVVPATVYSGPTRFRFINRGPHRHEVQLYRFRPGINADSARRLLAMQSYPDSLADQGGAVLVAQPGDTAVQQVLAVLDTTRVWALECAFRDTAKATPHNRMGMFQVLTVRNP
jgi:hypothetical protein